MASGPLLPKAVRFLPRVVLYPYPILEPQPRHRIPLFTPNDTSVCDEPLEHRDVVVVLAGIIQIVTRKQMMMPSVNHAGFPSLDSCRTENDRCPVGLLHIPVDGQEVRAKLPIQRQTFLSK